LRAGAIPELVAREHARSADAVAARRRAVEHDEVARGRRTGASDALGREEADAHRVDETVVLVAFVDDRLAADGRNSDAVSVGADPGHRPVELPSGTAEVEPVQERNRPRPHRHHVAENPPDSRRSSLERLDGGGMVVALDLEGDRLAVSEIDYARVLAGALEDACSFGRESLQEQGRVLVRAV